MAPRAFTYRAVAPMMWVLVSIGTVELLVTHLLVALWHPTVAILLSIVTVGSLAWLVRGILAFDRRPVLVFDDRVVIRVGSLHEVIVPRSSIGAVRTQLDGAVPKGRGVLKLSLISYPNVVIELDPPIPGRLSPIATILHRLDDPAAFAATLNAVRAPA